MQNKVRIYMKVSYDYRRSHHHHRHQQQYNTIQYSFISWNNSISTDIDEIGFTVVSLN